MVNRRGYLATSLMLFASGCSMVGHSKIDKKTEDLIVSQDFFDNLRKTGAGMNEDYYPSGYNEYAEALYNTRGYYDSESNDEHYVVHFVLDYGEISKAEEEISSWEDWLKENRGEPSSVDVGDEGLLASHQVWSSSIAIYRAAQMVVCFDETNQNGSTKVSNYIRRHAEEYT